MSFSPTPETVVVNGSGGSFFYNRPAVILKGLTRFLFMLDTTGVNWRIRVFVRDNGVLTWTECDAGNGPTVVRLKAGNDRLGCPTYLQDPLDATQVIMAYPRSADSTIAFTLFNTTTQKFGATVAGGPEVFGVDQIFQGNVNSDDTGAKTCVAYRAVDNSLVFLYQGPSEVVGADTCLRPYFVTYDRTGAAWGVGVPLVTLEDAPYCVLGVVIDPATAIAHCMIVRPNNNIGPIPPGTNYAIWHVAVESNGTIHAKDLATQDVYQIAESNVGYPILRTVGGVSEIIVPYKQQDLPFAPGNGVYAAVVRATVAITPVWTVERISTTAQGPIGDSFVTPSVALDSNTQNPYVFWFQQNLADPQFHYRILYSQGTNAGAGWTAPISPYSVPNPGAGDFLERPTVSQLAGVGIGVVSFISQINGAAAQVSYWELGIAPPATSAPLVRLNCPLPFFLPDPRILCRAAAQIPCKSQDGRNIQPTKGVTGFYAA